MITPEQGEISLPDFWLRLKAKIRPSLPASTFSSWIDSAELLSLEPTKLTLGTEHSSTKWMAARFGPFIAHACEEISNFKPTVQFVQIDKNQLNTDDLGIDQVADSGVLSLTEGFNPKYSFESFVIGESNRLAHAATLTVAEEPGETYNPLFIYGPPGSGKTHLLQAVGNYISEHTTNSSVTYTTAEAFTNNFVSSIQSGAISDFKAKFRNCDVLLIDDIQFLQRKSRTEEEFFHTFNALYEMGKQIVITCDRVPRHLNNLQKRLLERFESGLVADISPPDLGMKMTILRKLVKNESLPIENDDVLYEVAKRSGTNIRTLEGALIRIVAYHSLTQRELNVDLAREVLKRLYPETDETTRTSAVTVDVVKSVVCDYFQINETELVSKSRAAKFNWPRQVAIYLTREIVGLSLPEIGESFGGRSHNTALHSYRKTKERIASDLKAQSAVDNLLEKLRS